MTAPGLAPRLRVAFLARRFGKRFGGAEAYAEHLLAELARWHDIQVFCQEWDSALALPHVVLPRLPGLPRWLNLWRFSRQCAALTNGFDLVHSHENAPTGHVHGVHVMPVRHARQVRDTTWAKRVGTALSPRWQAYLRLEAARYRPAPDKVLVAASALIDAQIGQAYAHTARRVVITPGVAVPDGLPDRADARRQLGLDPDVTLAVLVANDPWRKGLATIVAAMQQPSARPWHLLVVGGEADTAERVRDAARAAGLAGRVHAWPGRRDVWPFYVAADIGVFPTRGDAFGMVPLETMALGRPVILSDSRYCGFAAHVTHGQDAWVLPAPEDASALAHAIDCLQTDAALAQRLGAGGLALAARFSWPALAGAMAAEYGRIWQVRQGLVAAGPTR